MSIVQVVKRRRQQLRNSSKQAGIGIFCFIVGVAPCLLHNQANAAEQADIVYECFSTEITFVTWNNPNENGDRFGTGEEEFSITVKPDIGIHADNWMLIGFSRYGSPSKPRYWDFNSRDSWSAVSPDGTEFVRFNKGSLAVSNVSRDSGSMFTLLAKCWG